MPTIAALAALLLFATPRAASAQEMTDAELAQWIAHVLDLEQRVARRGDDQALMIRLADAYAQLGDLRRALPALERLADMGVEPVRIALLRGDAFFTVGDFDEAARAYLDALQRAPRQTYALTQLWRLMLQATLSDQPTSFDRASVVETLQEAGLYFPDRYTPTPDGPEQASRLVDRASALILRHRSAEAIALLTRAITLDPGNAEAFAALARAYDDDNDAEAAMGASLVYLLLAPDAPDAARVRERIARTIEETNLR